MRIQSLKAKDAALVACFTALYVIFGFLSISPIIGFPAKITAAAIMAPVMGVILGPYLGSLSTFSGGIIGFFLGSFSPLSFASGIFASLCAGMLHEGKRIVCAIIYFSLLLVFGFYPFGGPIWLYPLLMWFQIVGLVLLISPLQASIVKNVNSNNNLKLLYTFFILSLVSTLAGQIAGSLVFEVLVSDVDVLKATWEFTMFIYPIERVIIALSAAAIGTSLYKVLNFTNMMPLNREKLSNLR